MSSKKKDISIRGARVHNLKSVDVTIPRNSFCVITGLSGSGKSSLAFDTLYAEGQRRYVESLSSYARQFLGRLDKPDVDAIEGIAPAIAIEQKVISRNSRSTVGTSTEIYDYLKLLFARIGRTISPISGKEVKADTVSDVVDYIQSLPEETRVMVLVPRAPDEGRTWEELMSLLAQQGYLRAMADGKVIRLDEAENQKAYKEFFLIVDRFSAARDEETQNRMTDSISTAFFEGRGSLVLDVDGKHSSFSDRFEEDGMLFERPTVHFFSFNNPVGACKVCEGFGSVIGIDEGLVIPDKSRSVFEEGVAAWRGEKMSEWKDNLIRVADKIDFPIHRPIEDLSTEQYEFLWHGNEHFGGIDAFFRYVESKAYKIQYRVMLSRYRGKTPCPDCNGSRLRKDANFVKVGGASISDLVDLPVDRCYDFFEKLKLDNSDMEIAERLLNEIRFRLSYLKEVGLGYLTLDRMSNTLSGGESQRINLATSLGSSLVGSMYILDEPSIGLHSHDTTRLMEVMRSLRDLGNTVIVVEHDEDIIRAADYIVDMGPEAGTLGGELVYQGKIDGLLACERSLTADYITGKRAISWPESRRSWNRKILIKGAAEHNLANVNVEIPLNILLAVTGVSGSGKTTLIKEILFPAIQRHLGLASTSVGKYKSLEGDLSEIGQIELVDQNPIGRSSRSNPATYVKAYDDVRALFASQPASDLAGYKAAHFSFNVPGGRCETCEGEGEVKIGMQFMADISLTCETCKGKRFKEEILEVRYKDKSISDVLEMTVDDAVAFFDSAKGACAKIREKVRPLQDVGLGYVKLGQPSSTLSGGEAQRIKLAFFLGKKDKQEKTLFIFDEPTTGLHFHDVSKLLDALNALVELGHSVIVIEHNLDMVKSADWVIDLGPEGGEKGGAIVFEGTPEQMADSDTLTARYLKLKQQEDMRLVS